jgi:hypothetical protein
MPTGIIDYDQLLKDFLVGDRRLGDRSDLIVDLGFGGPMMGVSLSLDIARPLMYNSGDAGDH